MHRLTAAVLALSFASLVCGCSDKQPGDTAGDTGSSGDDGADTEPTTGDPGGVCELGAKHEVMCFGGDEAESVAACEAGLADIEVLLGPACRAKYVDYARCVALASCQPGDACAAEEAELDCLPAPEAECSAYAAKVADCQPAQGSAAQIGGQCQLEVNDGRFDDPACGTAIAAHFACQAEQTCEQLFDSPDCIDEANTIGELCPELEEEHD